LCGANRVGRSHLRRTTTAAAALGFSPTTLYKYGFNRGGKAAMFPAVRLRGDPSRIRFTGYRRSWRRSVSAIKALVARIAIMEANAARLAFEPEEMFKPILKPVRTVSRIPHEQLPDLK
jgi:hypothetical protein